MSTNTAQLANGHGGERNAEEDIEAEIKELERKLEEAKRRLHLRKAAGGGSQADSLTPVMSIPSQPSDPPPSASAAHFLLLLSDSALPLGSFAFSSGLESYLAHERGRSRPFSLSPSPSTSSSSTSSASFAAFLPLSVSSYAATALPFALAAHDEPEASRLAELDDALDAATVCAVGRRASTAQGRALLSVWERSFVGSGALGGEAEGALRGFSALLKSSSSSSSSSLSSPSPSTLPPPVSGHLAPLFGAVARLTGLPRRQAAYVFVLAHARALVSAAVRAGLFGPYQAQRVLASAELQRLVAGAVEREWRTPVEEAGQSVPAMDLWFGRHELLYSRIFNS